MPQYLQELIAALVLVAVLGFAVIRPRGLPEAVAAVPGALALALAGIVTWREVGSQVHSMLPTVIFLAAVLMLSHLCQQEGLFQAAGDLMARGSRGEPKRLLTLVFVTASLITAVLSLDATVVLLTPVVFATASRLGVRPKPSVYATSHLANSASLLLPVSNLTNLLAMGAAGLSFVRFAGVMALPWLVAIGIEYVVFRRYFASDLSVRATSDDSQPSVPLPKFAVGVVIATLLGFVLCSPLHIEPFWAALAGVAALAIKQLVSRPGGRLHELRELAGSANLWFVAFVLALAVVVDAVVRHGLSGALQKIIPHGSGLLALLALAGLAAVLANVVNNLPAVLVLLPLASASGPLAVLAVLIGVNVGPNLTYVGSLATLLWRRIMADHDHDTELGEFTKLGLFTVPLSLIGCTLALWAGGQILL